MLKDAEELPLAFLLFAGTAPLSNGERRDCVLTGVPVGDPAAPVNQFIQSRKNTEFSAHVQAQGPTTRVVVDLGRGEELVIEYGPNGPNEWKARVSGRIEHEGPCEAVTK